ncbi:RagB/SusD family nutrient uptake outer membrane protein [Gilvibacter sp.]|uniref:RagB/SusD family nutrient uptake outer membrane protein n=1 Tax=Gilvibacter sp. TaxID=2729997 RepID=UPI0025BEFE55|nr:RagB/SusD family nutrient uptake outer membrane protein [Gilvibacter sp.]NQX77859.1 RagB/SusD family nutrient uptake outer membrane protein [Gilvibacter sp.]
MNTAQFLRSVFAFCLVVFCFAACSDDFVNVDSEDQNSENFFNTEEDYQAALIAAYDLLQSSYINVMLGEIASNNTLAGGESAIDVPGIQEIDDMRHTPINRQLQDIWAWMYAGVNRANFIMEFKDNLEFSGKDNVLGQTTFLRAYYYFELVKFFGDVPFAVDQRILFGDEATIERTPIATIYAQIEDDLEFSIANLPVVQDVPGRVTRGAAQALLGRVLLFQNKFSEARVVLDDLIATGTYSLVADFAEIWENEGENGPESVFEIQYTDVEGASFVCLQCSEGNVAVGFNGIRSFSGPLYDSGFSFNVPTQETYDAYEDGDLRRDVGILNIELFAEENAGFNGGAGVSWVEGFEHTGFYNRKYIARQGDSNIGDQNLTNPNNYRAIRYADVLLMAAEAHNRGGGSDVTAQMYLNEVRDRAGLGPVTATGSALTEAIYLERRLELVGEGHHFFDLVRTGRAATEIDGFQTGKHELFPIPAIEIQLAGNRWEQNPGY